MIGVTAGTPCRIVLDKSTNFYSSVHFSMPFPCAIYYQPRNLGSSHFLYFRSILSALALTLNCEECLHNYILRGGLLTTNTMLPSYLAPRPDFYKSSLPRYVIPQARITNLLLELIRKFGITGPDLVSHLLPCTTLRVLNHHTASSTDHSTLGIPCFTLTLQPTPFTLRHSSDGDTRETAALITFSCNNLVVPSGTQIHP